MEPCCYVCRLFLQNSKALMCVRPFRVTRTIDNPRMVLSCACVSRDGLRVQARNKAVSYLWGKCRKMLQWLCLQNHSLSWCHFLCLSCVLLIGFSGSLVDDAAPEGVIQGFVFLGGVVNLKFPELLGEMFVSHPDGMACPSDLVFH